MLDPSKSNWCLWPSSAWKEESYAFLINENQKGHLLQYSGAQISFAVEGEGAWSLEMLGLMPPGDGFWLWRGTCVQTHLGFSSQGVFRPATLEELASALEGDPILPPPRISCFDVEALWYALDASREATARVLRNLQVRELTMEEIKEIYDLAARCMVYDANDVPRTWDECRQLLGEK